MEYQIPSSLPTSAANNYRFNILGGHTVQSDVEEMVRAGIHQLQLLQEELDETFQAYADNDDKLLRDGLSDIGVVTDGLFYRLGVHYPSQAELNTPVYGTFGRDQIGNLIGSIQSDVDWLRGMFTLGAPALSTDQIRNDVRSFGGAILHSLREIYHNLPGVDYEADQLAVWNSNVSKYPRTVEHASQEMQLWSDKGVETYLLDTTVGGEVYYSLRLRHNTVINGKTVPAGKIIKPSTFREPVFIDPA